MHGVPGVSDQVEKHLLNLIVIADDPDISSVQLQRVTDADQAKFVENEIDGIPNHLVRIERRKLRFFVPGKPPEIVANMVDPLHVPLDHLGRFILPDILFGLPQEALGVHPDNIRRVQDFVRRDGADEKTWRVRYELAEHIAPKIEKLNSGFMRQRSPFSKIRPNPPSSGSASHRDCHQVGRKIPLRRLL